MPDMFTGDALKKAREDAMLTQSQMAAILGVSKLTVANLEGRSRIDDKYKRRLDRYLSGLANPLSHDLTALPSPYYDAPAAFPLPDTVDIVVAHNAAPNHGLCRWRLVIVGDTHPARWQTLATFWTRGEAERYLSALNRPTIRLR